MEKSKAAGLQESTLVCIGGPLKVTSTEAGMKVGGYLVRFTSEKDTDLDGEFFNAETDFGIPEYPAQVGVYINHGTDQHFKKSRVAWATITKDDFGIWAETMLKERDEYEKFVADMARKGKMGWSSATSEHLMDRKHFEGGVNWITKWPLVDATITHMPAEHRNVVQPVKSLIVEQPEATKEVVEPETHEEQAPEQIESTPKQEEKNIMDPEAIQKMIEEAVTKATEASAQQSEEAAKKAVEEYRKSEPAEKAASLTVTKDEGDQEWENNGKFFQAVKLAAMGHGVDKRLLAAKSNGLNESAPADGGYLVPAQTSGGIIERMYQMGKVLSSVSKDTVQGNAMSYNAVDESSRASTRQGGILGYWIGEGSTLTASKPQFRQIDLKLKKVVAAAYATDELIADANALESWLTRTVPNELVFQSEDAIINGNGVHKPLGVLNSPCLVSATRLDADKVQAADILGMFARRWIGGGSYKWFINQDVLPQIWALVDGGSNSMFMPNYNVSPGGALLGLPIIETEYNPTLGDVGDIILADMSQYQAIDKGMQSASSIHVQFLTDEMVYRFVYRIDGEPLWNSALTPFKGSNTQSPFVALAATT